MSWQQELRGYFKNRGRIENWAGVIAMHDLAATSREQQRNREAESSHVRKSVWGSDGVEENEEVGNTHLGDVNNPPPIIMPQQQSQLLPALALAIASAFGGYYLSNQNKGSEQPGFSDETVAIGLGRIEDFEKKESE